MSLQTPCANAHRQWPATVVQTDVPPMQRAGSQPRLFMDTRDDRAGHWIHSVFAMEVTTGPIAE